MNLTPERLIEAAERQVIWLMSGGGQVEDRIAVATMLIGYVLLADFKARYTPSTVVKDMIGDYLKKTEETWPGDATS